MGGIAMIDQVATAITIATRYDNASEGSREVLASWIDDIASTITDPYARGYLHGVADGLRRQSKSRRIRGKQENH